MEKIKKVNLRKLLAFLLVLVVVVIPIANTAYAAGPTFSDVPAKHWAHDYIEDLYSKGVISGYSNGLFKPNNNLTRAQVAKMIVIASGLDYEGKVSDFKDVSKDNWATGYIAAAKEAGIICGYSDGSFKPNANVTRAQIAKMIIEAFNLKATNNSLSFFDVSETNWANEYIKTLASNGIVSGYSDGTFKPNDPVTRAQFSKILSIALDVSKGEGIKGDSSFEVHFIDVGQADASLVICDGETMLIDGGNRADSSLIYTYLKNREIDHLDYIVNTHPHEDHVGGLAGALQYATVGVALSPVKSYDSQAFNNFVKYLGDKNVSLTIPSAGDKFKLGSATVQVLGPINIRDDMNNNSIVLKITYKDTSFLFTGDAEREEEQDILAQGYDLSSTVLKVGHHGGENSTTYPFLREIMPKYAVISVGSNNSYGHPTENTLSRLRDANVKVFRTDIQGDIICRSDGTNVSFTVDRNADADTLAPITNPNPSHKPEPEQPAEGRTVYYTPNGKSYHYTKDCPTLARSKQ